MIDIAVKKPTMATAMKACTTGQISKPKTFILQKHTAISSATKTENLAFK